MLSKVLYNCASLSIKGRPFLNLQFADGTNPMAGRNRELHDLTNEQCELVRDDVHKGYE